MAGFDWKVPARCEYGIPMPGHPDGVDDCREPATHRVWWADDESDAMALCAAHFEKVRVIEEGEA